MSSIQELSIMDRNPIQESDYKKQLIEAGIPFTIENGRASVTGYGVGGNGAQPLNPTTAIAGVQTQQAGQTAQTNYQAGIDSAVSSLREQGTSLDTQYKSLLNNVLGQGTVAMNTITGATNTELGRRGITNDSLLYGQIMGSAQLPVQVANQTATENLGYTEAGLQNTLAQNIANIKAGGAGTAAGLPLSYGSLALSQAANVANISLAGSQAAATGVSARYVPIPGYGMYDTQTKQLIGGLNGVPGQGVTNVNGVPSLYIP